MNKMTARGPRIEPCGMPIVTGAGADHQYNENDYLICEEQLSPQY